METRRLSGKTYAVAKARVAKASLGGGQEGRRGMGRVEIFSEQNGRTGIQEPLLVQFHQDVPVPYRQARVNLGRARTPAARNLPLGSLLSHPNPRLQELSQAGRCGSWREGVLWLGGPPSQACGQDSKVTGQCLFLVRVLASFFPIKLRFMISPPAWPLPGLLLSEPIYHSSS